MIVKMTVSHNIDIPRRIVFSGASVNSRFKWHISEPVKPNRLNHDNYPYLTMGGEITTIIGTRRSFGERN